MILQKNVSTKRSTGVSASKILHDPRLANDLGLYQQNGNVYCNFSSCSSWIAQKGHIRLSSVIAHIEGKKHKAALEAAKIAKVEAAERSNGVCPETKQQCIISLWKNLNPGSNANG